MSHDMLSATLGPQSYDYDRGLNFHTFSQCGSIIRGACQVKNAEPRSISVEIWTDYSHFSLCWRVYITYSKQGKMSVWCVCYKQTNRPLNGDSISQTKLVEDAADLIKVNSRPSPTKISRADLISRCKIRYAATASDLRSDVLGLFRPQLRLAGFHALQAHTRCTRAHETKIWFDHNHVWR